MERNNLYPIFIKTDKINTLIVGGGNVALEKLTFLLKSSPNSCIEMIAPHYRSEILKLTEKYSIKLNYGSYAPSFLIGKQLVVATTDNLEVNLQVYEDCREQCILVNLADNPAYCDFYMGSIVTKGNVKVAISTNGKSPTTAKRLRQYFEAEIPDKIDDLVINLREYRKTLTGDFNQKVEALNAYTESLIKKNE